MSAENPTGFEAWVKMGIALGAAEVMEVTAEVLKENPHLAQADDPHCEVEIDYDQIAAVVAERLQSRWPPWKASNTKQTELPLDQVECAACHRLENPKARMFDTPHGILCPRCMHLYIDRKWPEESAPTT